MERDIRLSIRMFSVMVSAVAIACAIAGDNANAATIFESGTLGPTGVSNGDGVPAANLSATVFDGVRFQLTQPVIASRVGGHFFANPSIGNSFFGAIVRLDNGSDFPDSGNLSTPDVLGHTFLTFPSPSAEVFGDLNLNLAPGWYALVFGSGLFGTNGNGAMPLNNPDIGSPNYIAYVAGFGWSSPIDPIFRNFRFVVQGNLVPEPALFVLMLIALFFSLLLG